MNARTHAAFALPCVVQAPPRRRPPLRARVRAALEPWADAAAAAHGRRPAPHAGSHFARRARAVRFFEGWYLRAVLPGRRAFAFMFSAEAADGSDINAAPLVAAQFLGPAEDLRVRTFAGGRWFADPDDLAFGFWGRVDGRLPGPPRTLSRSAFSREVQEGFQLTDTLCCGRFEADDGSGPVEWDLAMEPVLSWGTRGEQPRCTASWLSHLPVFEPGYQVLMAHGVATEGTIWAEGQSWDLAGARVYCEKNWGQSFPKKWWWLQANTFEDHPDLTLTAVGAQRLIAGVYEEEIGMISIHYNGEMFEFSNWNSTQLSWRVTEWGCWETSAKSRTGYTVSIFAETAGDGAFVLGPSQNGMVFNVRDAAYGRLDLRLWDPSGKKLLDRAVCDSAQVEIGGGPWDDVWLCSVKPLSQPLRGIINMGSSKVKTSL